MPQSGWELPASMAEFCHFSYGVVYISGYGERVGLNFLISFESEAYELVVLAQYLCGRA